MAATHFHSTLPLVDDPDSTGTVSDALDTTALSSLSSGQGAQVTTRENAADAAERARESKERRHEQRRLSGSNRPTYARHEQAKVSISRGQIIGLVAAIAVVVGVLLFVFNRCASSVAENPATQQLITSSSLQATPGMSVTYGGSTYELGEADGSWRLFVTNSSGETTPVSLEGKPVMFAIYNNDTVYIPENLSDGSWNVVAYLLAEGSVLVRVPNAAGEGVITEGTLADSVLTLTTEAGETVNIPLD